MNLTTRYEQAATSRAALAHAQRPNAYRMAGGPPLLRPSPLNLVQGQRLATNKPNEA